MIKGISRCARVYLGEHVRNDWHDLMTKYVVTSIESPLFKCKVTKHKNMSNIMSLIHVFSHY